MLYLNYIFVLFIEEPIYHCTLALTKICTFFVGKRWTIRARVTNKSGIRTWSNSKGEGKLFSIDLLDESVSSVLYLVILFQNLRQLQQFLDALVP